MKPIKKLLTMSLATSLVLSSLCLASATYKDQDNINQTQAVQTLTDRGILNGKSDGNFDPSGNLTRGEMAKMIYVLKTNSNDATPYDLLSTSFRDITTSWASSYIKYAAKEGILAGRSETIFDPDASVTGMEEAKMLLIYLGYDAESNGLTSSNWSANVQTLGAKCNLFSNFTASLTDAITREDAAQMMYNAIHQNEDENSSSDIDSDYTEWESGKMSKTDNGNLAGLVIDKWISQNEDGNNVLYLNLLTADGIKKDIETDVSTSAPGTTNINKGSILSFWGQNYNKIEDLGMYNYPTLLTDTRNYAAVKGYNASTGRITFYNGLYNGTVKTNFTAAKITNDTVVIYIDQSDNDWTVLQDGNITVASPSDTGSGYTANVFVSLNEDDSSKIDLLVVELNNKILDDSQNLVALTTSAS